MDAIRLSDSSCGIPSASAVSRKVGTLNRVGGGPRNRLLATLPRDALSSLMPHLKPVLLPRNRVLCEVNERLAHVYFVETGLVSVVTVFDGQTTAEMATVGPEGFVGIGVLLGGWHPLGRYAAPVPGFALAIEVPRFRSALRASPALRTACETYAQAFLREALQTAACNSVHMVEERFARRLLMNHDRSDGNTITLTQEYLAKALGVCRSTVTLAAGALQSAGLISYRRGAITVLDRAGLERASCECYRVIRSQYERFLPQTYERQSSLV
jgi:CRP-like cAMP-binding protein